MNLAQRFESTAERTPDKVAFLVDDGPATTFAEFDALASELAGGLVDLGVEPGDRVAVLAGSNVEFVATMCAIWKVGAVSVAVNAQLAPPEVLYQLQNSAPRVVVAEPGPLRALVDGIVAEAPSVLHVVDLGGHRGAPRRAIDLADDQPATIFYTSGTTGVPKGATHTHRAVDIEVRMVVQHLRQTPDDVFLSVLPIYLLSILLLGPLCSLHLGATCRIQRRYDPVAFARAVRGDRTTVIGASIPMMFSDLLNLPPDEAAAVDLSSVRIASCGGSPMPPEVRKAFEERYDFRFVHAYGGTEGPAMVSTDPLDRPRKFDSVGVALPHVRITVEDEDGKELPVGELGEICTSAFEDGPYAGLYEPISEYWQMPEATAEALRGGKLHWGDLGYLDDDGYLYLVDRKKDMIIRGGMNVYPKELEGLLYDDDRIVECAVVAAPHERYGEVPVAFVRVAPGSTVTEDEVRALVAERSAPFKHLQGVTFVEDFPRNALGKILKRELRAGAAAGPVG
ncbi:MAG: class I adenylate-forming enzyme family protein [Acidimicrobiia bacterium]